MSNLVYVSYSSSSLSALLSRFIQQQKQKSSNSIWNRNIKSTFLIMSLLLSSILKLTSCSATSTTGRTVASQYHHSKFRSTSSIFRTSTSFVRKNKNKENNNNKIAFIVSNSDRNTKKQYSKRISSSSSSTQKAVSTNSIQRNRLQKVQHDSSSICQLLSSNFVGSSSLTTTTTDSTTNDDTSSTFGHSFSTYTNTKKHLSTTKGTILKLKASLSNTNTKKQQYQYQFQRQTRLFASSTEINTDMSKEQTTTTGSKDTISPYDIINRQRGLGDKYEPKTFEKDIYEWYESSGCFIPRHEHPNNTNKKPYVLPMPPPNVTGRLHMGHAIFVTIQDVLARYYRMRQHPVLWLPGTDHAGIATQLQVEKLLAKEIPTPVTRQQLGRTEFVNRVWHYKNEQEGYITQQLRQLGASADWTRERFTLDTDLNVAVNEAFVRLYNKGLIYRGEYIVNWAPLLQTAVSDLEVDYTEEIGKLYYFKYMIEPTSDNSDAEEYIPVATTRPETIFGDTAVCVNPNDERYKHLIGKNVIVPLSGTTSSGTTSKSYRTVPVIADEYVDIDFGTGALKITPGHDPNDYTLGKKYNLPIINIMNKDGTMNENVGSIYEGLDRFDCRTKLWNDMTTANLTIQIKENHIQRIPRSQRGGDIIEPMISRQWFCITDNMAKQALNAVECGDIKIIPSRFEKIWYNWLNDNRDWCISRQLWWGHQIPVWYIHTTTSTSTGSTPTTIDSESTTPVVPTSNDNVPFVVARNEEEAIQKVIEMGYNIHDVTLVQDEDVLDTWFSSGLWPFATVGWPQNEFTTDSDYSKYYPASCLETGYDILFFWVARMVMMGIELTGKSPFNVIYLHGLVRAADGTKMSKTKGNVIDPIETVDTYGADSLRYSLVTGVTPGQDIPFNIDKVESNRNFANKLWNICKFVTSNALQGIQDNDEQLQKVVYTGPMSQTEFNTLQLPEQYIINKCHQLIISVTKDIENYNLGAAGSKVYDFLWDDYADWYIEISKTRLYENFGASNDPYSIEATNTRRVLLYVLDTTLRLLHPYMPFVTEHLWHHLPKPTHITSNENNENSNLPNALMLSTWPQMVDENGNEEKLASFLPEEYDERIQQYECLQSMTRKIRNARAEYNVEPAKKIKAYIVASGSIKIAIEQELKSLIQLARLDPDGVIVYETNSTDVQTVLGIGGIHNTTIDDSTIANQFVRLVIQDNVDAYLPLSNLIDPIKEMKRLEKEYEKLQKDIDKLQIRLSSDGFVGKAPQSIVDKTTNELTQLQIKSTKIQTSLNSLINK